MLSQMSPLDLLEMAFAAVLREAVNSLDAHMAVYARNPDGTRGTNFDEAISISVVQRTAYEACHKALQLFDSIPESRAKHRVCAKVCKKFISDTHCNNLVVDHPRADATKFALGLRLFLQALHFALHEKASKEDKEKHVVAYFRYSQVCHAEDTRVTPVVH